MFVQHRARGESHAASSPAQSYIICVISILHTLRPLVILYQILFAICGVNTRLTPHISPNNRLYPAPGDIIPLTTWMHAQVLWRCRTIDQGSQRKSSFGEEAIAIYRGFDMAEPFSRNWN